jgi:hypothetical protein
MYLLTTGLSHFHETIPNWAIPLMHLRIFGVEALHRSRMENTRIWFRIGIATSIGINFSEDIIEQVTSYHE